jgi:hypothetical protein
MAAKKTKKSKKSGRKAVLLDTDPPILVGGGGSTYLWVNLDQGETPVNPQLDHAGIGINPGAPKPQTRQNYVCSRVSRTPPKLFFHNGVSVNPDGSPVEVQLDIPVAGRPYWYIRLA